MLDTISDIASVITCILFVFYIAGHIWRVIVSKKTRYEKFEIVPCASEADLEDKDNVLLLDETGTAFSISSAYGVRRIQFYKVSYELHNDGSLVLLSKELEAAYDDLQTSEALYVRCDLGECVPTTQVEVERMDYTKVTFEIGVSGKNGHIITTNYTFRMTLRGLLYYLCM